MASSGHWKRDEDVSELKGNWHVTQLHQVDIQGLSLGLNTFRGWIINK